MTLRVQLLALSTILFILQATPSHSAKTNTVTANCDVLTDVCTNSPPDVFDNLCKRWCVECMEVPDVKYGEFEFVGDTTSRANRTAARSCPKRRLYKYIKRPQLSAAPPACQSLWANEEQYQCPPTTRQKATTVLNLIFRRFGPSDSTSQLPTNESSKDTTEESHDNVRNRRQPQDCSFTDPIDLAILLDASGSVGAKNFNSTINDVASLVEHTCNGFTCGTPEIQFALVTFDNSPVTVFDFNYSASNHHSRRDIVDSILTTNYTGGNTGTRAALLHISNAIFNESHGMRKNSTKKLLILTDGKHNVGGNPQEVAESLHQRPGKESIDVFAIGIGRKLTYHRLRSLVHIKVLNRILPFLSYYSFSEFSRGIRLVIADAKLSKDACSSTSVKK